LLVLGRRHLEVVLAEYVEHYNSHRPHRGIHLQVPVPGDGTSATHPTYKVRRHDVLGGLIHEYRPMAA
jgi:hypothetical protein